MFSLAKYVSSQCHVTFIAAVPQTYGDRLCNVASHRITDMGTPATASAAPTAFTTIQLDQKLSSVYGN